MYCLSKEWWPILYIKLLYKMGHCHRRIRTKQNICDYRLISLPGPWSNTHTIWKSIVINCLEEFNVTVREGATMMDQKRHYNLCSYMRTKWLHIGLYLLGESEFLAHFILLNFSKEWMRYSVGCCNYNRSKRTWLTYYWSP